MDSIVSLLQIFNDCSILKFLNISISNGYGSLISHFPNVGKYQSPKMISQTSLKSQVSQILMNSFNCKNTSLNDILTKIGMIAYFELLFLFLED